MTGYDKEKIHALTVAMKILMAEHEKTPNRRYIEAHNTLYVIKQKMLEGHVRPVFADAIAPFMPHTPTEDEKTDLFERGADA